MGSLGNVIGALVASLFVRQQARPSIKFVNRADLIAVKELVETGKVKPVIDGTYALSETPAAMRRVADGHARGTVVITMAQPPIALLPSLPASHAAGPAADTLTAEDRPLARVS